MSEHKEPIPSRIYNAAQGGHVCGADDIDFDKEYAPADFSGMGKIVLKKNMVNGVNTLIQSMISEPNTIYIISYDYNIIGTPFTRNITFSSDNVTQIKTIEKKRLDAAIAAYEDDPTPAKLAEKTRCEEEFALINNQAYYYGATTVVPPHTTMRMSERGIHTNGSTTEIFDIIRNTTDSDITVYLGDLEGTHTYYFDYVVELPQNSILKFEGGSFNNGLIIGNKMPTEDVYTPEQFGAGKTSNDTYAIQSALYLCNNIEMNGDYNVYVQGKQINAVGNSIPVTELIQSDTVITLNGTVSFKNNNLEEYQVFSILTKNNIVLKGFGKIIGDKDFHIGTRGEYGHGIYLDRAKNIIIDGLEIYNFWGDSICFSYAQNPISENIIIKNVNLHHSRRQGISVELVKNLKVFDFYIHDIGGTAPGAAIDFENEMVLDRGIDGVECINGKIHDCTIGFTFHHGRSVPYNNEIVNVYLENIDFGNTTLSTNYKIKVVNCKSTNGLYPQKGASEFINCSFGSINYISTYETDENNIVKFINCKTDRIHTSNSTRGNILFKGCYSINPCNITINKGIVIFDNCNFNLLCSASTFNLTSSTKFINCILKTDAGLYNGVYENCNIIDIKETYSNGAFLTNLKMYNCYLEVKDRCKYLFSRHYDFYSITFIGNTIKYINTHPLSEVSNKSPLINVNNTSIYGNVVRNNTYGVCNIRKIGPTTSRPVAAYLNAAGGTSFPTYMKQLYVGFVFKLTAQSGDYSPGYYVLSAIDSANEIFTWTEEVTYATNNNLFPEGITPHTIPVDAPRDTYGAYRTNAEYCYNNLYVGYQVFDRDTQMFHYISKLTRTGEEGSYTYDVEWVVKTPGIGVLWYNSDIGFEYFDTTINKVIYAKVVNKDGTVTWVDSNGNDVSTSYITKSGTLVSGNVPEFDGTNGAIKDSGKVATNIVTTNGTLVSGNVPEFDGASGVVKDSGKAATNIP